MAMLIIRTECSSNYRIFRYDRWMTKMCSLVGILTRDVFLIHSVGVVDPERARKGMQTSLDEVSITELESSLDERQRSFGFHREQ